MHLNKELWRDFKIIHSQNICTQVHRASSLGQHLHNKNGDTDNTQSKYKIFVLEFIKLQV